MILIKPSTEILAVTPDVLGLIETAGRVCYKSEEKITETSSVDFITMLLKRGHESVLEHSQITAKFICDRGVTHEIVRHRLASYSQESTRYCDYDGAVKFVIPPWVNIAPGEYAEEALGLASKGEAEWVNAMFNAEEAYNELRAAGWRPELARSVLPNSLKTEIVMTANIREWRHFFKLRAAMAAHPQMREVATMLLAQMREIVPVAFDDLEVKS